MINGIINVYKEEGFTSFDVVAKLRGITHIRKIGHTGTLDPDAVGVLPVCIGNATKLCDLLTDKTKEYVAELKLGITTDTLDISGKVLSSREVNVTREEFRKAILGFKGNIQQIPPMYSALKVDGKKLCDLARKGIEIERKPREVEISEIEILDISKETATIRVQCSKGTYIRTLCNDIGERLGCGAVMTKLVRTRSGNFLAEEAYRLDEIEKLAKENRLGEILLCVDKIFEEYPRVVVSDEIQRRVLNGNEIEIEQDSPKIRVYLEDETFVAIYERVDAKRHYKPYKMFLN